jgi:hypothetical protein
VDTGLLLPSRRAFALTVVLRWRLALAAVAVTSAVVRTWAGWQHVTPFYFPDESTYASLSRSLAAGQLPSVRGQLAHFPSLLEPLLTAPAWWFGSLETGYRITQTIGTVAISTTALVVWWGARRLGADRRPALAAAVLAVAIPDAGYGGWILSEPFAYPLFVGAIVAGASSLARPTRRTQTIFLAFALAAAFARMQLIVLIPAYFLAALLVRRLRALRAIAVGAVAASALVGVAAAGFYHGSVVGALSPAEAGRTALVLALAGGWIVVPAGLLGIVGAWLRPAVPEQRTFAAYAACAGGGVLLEAVLYGDTSMVHERYAFYVLPLIFLGFALHASRGWPWLRAHALLAVTMLLVASSVTLAGWSTSHSLLLLGLVRLQQLTGSAGVAGITVALVAGACSLGSIAFAWRRSTTAVAVCGIAFCLIASALVTSFDGRNSRSMKAIYLPAGANWISAPATVVLGTAARPDVFQQFFWNRNAKTLALLPGVAVPDTFDATDTGVGPNGRLAGLAGRVVLDESGSAFVPREPLRLAGSWLEARTPALGAELDGRYGDGWIAPLGTVRLFGGTIAFAVVAPETMHVTVGKQIVKLKAHVPVRLVLSGCGKLPLHFSAFGWAGMRSVSARSTFPVWTSRGGCGAPRVTAD